MVGFVTPTRGGRMVGANKSTIAQWIRLCLPSCCPGFNSQARHLCFYHNSQICAIFVHAMWEKNENKQKEAEFGQFKKIIFWFRKYFLLSSWDSANKIHFRCRKMFFSMSRGSIMLRDRATERLRKRERNREVEKERERNREIGRYKNREREREKIQFSVNGVWCTTSWPPAASVSFRSTRRCF